MSKNIVDTTFKEKGLQSGISPCFCQFWHTPSSCNKVGFPYAQAKKMSVRVLKLNMKTKLKIVPVIC